MLSRPRMLRADSSELLAASFEQIDTTSTASPDISLSSEEETAIDEELLQSAKVDIIVEASPLVKKDSGIEEAVDLSESMRSDDTQSSTQTMEELIAGLEARLLSVIIANHQETMSRIGTVEAKMGERMALMGKRISDAQELTLAALKKESRESGEAILHMLRTNVAQITPLHQAENTEGQEGQRKEKCSTARACEVAKKGAIDCFDKIRSKCRKGFGKTSAVSEDAVSVAAEAQADDKKEEEDENLETVVLTKPVIKLAFKEGSKGAQCWVVGQVIHDTPYRLREGDEIVTIDGVDATSIPHARISKIMGGFQKKCTLEIRRRGVGVKQVDNVEEATE